MVAEGGPCHFFFNMILHGSQMKLSWVHGTAIRGAIPAVTAPMHYGLRVIIFSPLTALFTSGGLWPILAHRPLTRGLLSIGKWSFQYGTDKHTYIQTDGHCDL